MFEFLLLKKYKIRQISPYFTKKVNFTKNLLNSLKITIYRFVTNILIAFLIDIFSTRVLHRQEEIFHCLKNYENSNLRKVQNSSFASDYQTLIDNQNRVLGDGERPIFITIVKNHKILDFRGVFAHFQYFFVISENS